MRKYELMIVFRPQLDEETIDAALNRYTEIITGAGGEVTNVDKWGKRRLAYEIDKNTEGYYVVMNFTATTEAVNELDRILKITDEPIRHLLVRDEQ
ncbi:MAG: 30S ribosomal protein S6 [Firmicutes bacterium]|nr:30S ribosomal protein S6 [Bacillota bacterium]